VVCLREAYGRERFGRLMAFLFVWQFILSGPLEIASGYIGFAKYLGYLWPGMTHQDGSLTLRAGLVVIAVGVLAILLLYRRIGSVAKITVWLWTGVMITIAAVIVTGATHFNSQ